MKLFRACDCYHYPCHHNPPEGMKAVTRKYQPGFWFVKKDMSLMEKLYRKYIQDYNL